MSAVPAETATIIDRFDEMESIKRFLARPSLLYNSELSTGSTGLIQPISVAIGGQTPLTTFEFPKDLLAVGNKLEKVNNFEWFKADVCLRILTNTNPFVAGRLWVTFAPLDTLIDPPFQIANKGRCGITSYPGVEIDLQTNTAAEIIIPWVSVYDGVSLTSDLLSLVKVDIWLLSPITASDNSTTVPIQVYGHFINVNIQSPTPIPAVLQIGKEAPGPITQIASGVSQVSKKLAKIPILGTVASNVGWAADLASGVASIFGWSKPIDGSNAAPVSLIPGRGFNNFTAKDSSVVMGMSAENSVCEEDLNFLSEVDETTIEHVCGRPAVIDVANFSTDTPVGTILTQMYAAPFPTTSNLSPQIYDGVNYIVHDMPLCDNTIDRFKMWRGNIHYRFSFVKTAFHVGRVEAVFVPGDALINTFTDSTNAWRQVFDLTSESEFEIVVPYIHKNIMLNSHVNDYGMNKIGTLYLKSLTALKAPSTVGQTIQCIVWKWMTDVAVAGPIGSRSKLTPTPLTHKKVRAELQINVENASSVNKFVIFDRETTMDENVNACKIVGGEICVSLRHASRGFRVANVDLSQPILNSVSSKLGGYLGYCSQIFSFWRGGINWKFINNSDSSLQSFIYDHITTGAGEIDRDLPMHYTPSNNPVHEISVPYYNNQRRGLCNKTVPELDSIYIGVTVPTATAYVAGKDDCTFGFLIGAPIYAYEVAM